MATATLTFLFTDIEGSTAILRRLGGETYADLLSAHHRLMAEGIGAGGGRVVDTQGDSFFAMFGSASAAVETAVALQRAVASHPWPGGGPVRVRMGLHSGEAREGLTGIVGLDVHQAARIAAAAHGGQVVASTGVVALARRSLPPDVGFADLGAHRLKDFDGAEHLFQLEAPGLQDRFPPLRASGSSSHNLPAQPTSFVGRTDELARVREALGASRLVTLAGPGGTGKTRLALEVALGEAELRRDGVWLADLAPVRDRAGVVREVAAAVGAGPGRDAVTVQGLADRLGTQAPLLVLDNCEHVVDGCAELVAHLLRSCPNVVMVVTSREPLGVAGEKVLRIPPLGVPSTELGADPLVVAQRSEAVALFVERARSYDDGFVLDAQTAPSVASICRRLEGLPLALELAAARLGAMTVGDLEGRVENHLRLRTARGEVAVERHQTVRALVDWSYRLLDPGEQRALRRLSVFGGPFDLDAAAAVCGDGSGEGDDADADAAEELVFSLVAKSLVLPDAGGAFTRYRLLESVRQFAAELLGTDPGERADARARLVGHYTALAARAEKERFGPQEERWLERLAEEQPNLLAALGYADEGMGTEDRGLGLAASLYEYWLMEQPALGVEVLERALAHDTPGQPVAVRTKAMWVLAEACAHAGLDARALELCDAAFPAACEAGDLVAAAQCRKIAAMALGARRQPERAAAMYEEAGELARRSGDPMTMCQVEHDTGLHRMGLGDFEGARRCLERARLGYEESGAMRYALIGEVSLGNLLEATGDLEGSRACFVRVHGLLKDRRRGLVGPLAWLVSANLSALSLLQGDTDGALEHLPAVMANAYHHPAAALLVVAMCATATGDHETASELFGAADAVARRSGLGVTLLEDGQQALDAARDALRADPTIDFTRLYAGGGRLSTEEAGRLAERYLATASGRSA